ncbi:hypothetical protein [Pseudomonas viridiflava]|uniref:hypothetical protein n=1 Tax=Pseudomonas viridiflava TaxID=33069 RepID=UPI000F0220D1|nr:hypothetical protein [Pseudomonas viridiflava]
MNDYAIFLTHRVDCIAGKPPPTKKRFHSADYVLFDKRRLAGVPAIELARAVSPKRKPAARERPVFRHFDDQRSR